MSRGNFFPDYDSLTVGKILELMFRGMAYVDINNQPFVDDIKSIISTLQVLCSHLGFGPSINVFILAQGSIILSF